MLKFILCMEGGTLKSELLNYFGLTADLPTSSAFVQQRSKIDPYVFSELFYLFNERTTKYHISSDYRVTSIDGSSIPISYDKNDKDTFINNTDKGYNAYHLNALFDLINKSYIDFVLQPGTHMNEISAACEMIDRNTFDSKTIFIADRGYESWNLYAHIMQKNQYFLIRAKDIGSNGQLSNLSINEDEFDIDWNIILTRSQTVYKTDKSKYKFLSTSSNFDYCKTKDDPDYEMTLRVVRFKITDSTYECIITNLPRGEFPPEKIKEYYHLRWGIETSFRELKYAINLNAFHAKKRESIKQEIYARMVMYNFSMIIAKHVQIKKEKEEKKNKHTYQINYTNCIMICIYFYKEKGGNNPPDIEPFISQEILPVRTDRNYIRKVKPKSAEPFNYRFK